MTDYFIASVIDGITYTVNFILLTFVLTLHTLSSRLIDLMMTMMMRVAAPPTSLCTNPG